MNDLKILGILCEKLNGEFVFVPVSVANSVRVQREKEEGGKIIKSPTPEQARIAKEKKEDYSLTGRLKKHEEVSKEELQ